MTKPSGLVQGTLDVLILKTLSWEAMHGYAISRWIRQRTDNVLTVEDAALYQPLHRLRQTSADALQVSHGSLYPALHKLESDGLIESEWRAGEGNRRAKFYTLTRLGRKQLHIESNNWERLSTAISAVLRLREV